MGYRIGVIGGDGIGPEVVAEALKVVRAAGVDLDTVDYDLGGGRYLATGEVLPDTVLDELRSLDAILLGAVGRPDVPPGVLERGLLLRLRFELDLYINLRPFVGAGLRGPNPETGLRGPNPETGLRGPNAETGLRGPNAEPGLRGPNAEQHLDFVVVRENTEGVYSGEGGFLRKGTPQEIATQGSINTRMGVERCVRFAFELAASRTRRHLTLVHKTNVLTYSGDLWQRTFSEVAAEYPQVATAYHHVDASCIHLVESPERYDVIVTDNLFGDILTDLAGAVSGGIGHAASANLNPHRTGPSLFEPVHGSAPDIVGTGKANPVAAIRSAAMMLEFLGESEAAERIHRACEGAPSPPAATTSEIGDAVAARL